MEIELACSLPGEAEMLHAALSDFTETGARANYAKWLREQGDSKRAETVEATIVAYRTLCSDPINDLNGTSSWRRMLGVDLLRCYIEQSDGHFDLDDRQLLRDRLFPLVRPMLSLEYEPCEAAPKIGSSYLWGEPDFPEDQHWPNIGACSENFGGHPELPLDHPCAFYGQFSFHDLSGTVLGVEAPKSGGFAVFGYTDDKYIGGMETYVRSWDPTGRLHRMTHPSALSEGLLGEGHNEPVPFHQIQFVEQLSIPDASSPPFSRLLPQCQFGEKYYDFYRALHNECVDNLLGIGGYMSHATGDDPTPDIGWIRLAVLRVTPEAGVIHLAIPEEDFQSGDLSGVRYVWHDWDG